MFFYPVIHVCECVCVWPLLNRRCVAWTPFFLSNSLVVGVYVCVYVCMCGCWAGVSVCLAALVTQRRVLIESMHCSP